MPTLGLDIGGANLKAALATGWACSVTFPLWKQPELLATALRELASRAPRHEAWAVTMTGELADCFADKTEGVTRILEATATAAEGRPLRVWSTTGEWLAPHAAISRPFDVAAANWHVLATWVARHLFLLNGTNDQSIGSGLLVDVGSTTTDIIPFSNGQVLTTARTDLDRLCSNQLVYTGFRRTPLAAISREVPFRGATIAVASELFATSLDLAILVYGEQIDPDDRDTADGQPATVEAARTRIARMLCADRTELSPTEIDALARSWADTQAQQIANAVSRQLPILPALPGKIVVSGSGASLAKAAIGRVPELATVPQVSLSDQFSSEGSSAACAVALAQLADAS
jgi:(4-(4-[2-(gamma-L-glutamylamino)ethyl]phenoxymethyl)furan-2-yl)methanamine synthase